MIIKLDLKITTHAIYDNEDRQNSNLHMLWWVKMLSMTNFVFSVSKIYINEKKYDMQ